MFVKRPNDIAATGAAITHDGDRWCRMYQPVFFSIAQNLYCLLHGYLSSNAPSKRKFGSLVKLEAGIKRGITLPAPYSAGTGGYSYKFSLLH